MQGGRSEELIADRCARPSEAASMERDGALKADQTENKRWFQKSLSTSRDSNVVTPFAPAEDANFIQHHCETCQSNFGCFYLQKIKSNGPNT